MLYRKKMFQKIMFKQIEDWPLIKVYGKDFREDLNIMYNVIEEKEL